MSAVIFLLWHLQADQPYPLHPRTWPQAPSGRHAWQDVSRHLGAEGMCTCRRAQPAAGQDVLLHSSSILSTPASCLLDKWSYSEPVTWPRGTSAAAHCIGLTMTSAEQAARTAPNQKLTPTWCTCPRQASHSKAPSHADPSQHPGGPAPKAPSQAGPSQQPGGPAMQRPFDT